MTSINNDAAAGRPPPGGRQSFRSSRGGGHLATITTGSRVAMPNWRPAEGRQRGGGSACGKGAARNGGSERERERVAITLQLELQLELELQLRSSSSLVLLGLARPAPGRLAKRLRAHPQAVRGRQPKVSRSQPASARCAKLDLKPGSGN